MTGNFTVLITPTLADIDADGDLDLFLTDQGNGVDIWYYENVGSQNWPDFQFTTSSWQSIDIYSALQRYLRFWDMDEDGDLDLFFYNNWNEPGSSNLRCYRNDGTPQNPNMNLVTSTYLPLSVDIAVSDFCDIDSDGRDDLFVGEMNGGILFFHGVDTSAVPPLPRTAPYRGLVLSVGSNPANPVTTFSFELRAASFVNLEVYDVSGRRVAELLSGRQEAGAHVVTWDASGLGSGVYLARLQVGGESQAGKVVVVK